MCLLCANKFEKLPPWMINKKNTSQVMVAPAWNPSYLGGNNQENQDSKPAQANSS
jgi:hypothetical protein